jgi:CheY-like chemotaxis protein
VEAVAAGSIRSDSGQGGPPGTWLRAPEGHPRSRRAFRGEPAVTFHSPQSATILAIDDDPAVLADLAEALAGGGYACHTCGDPDAAQELAERLSPDLIVSDINLGEASGLDLCARLKRLPALADVPVMFLSGAQIPDVIRRAHAAGGVYYLRKPFDPPVLLELVEKALWVPHVVGARLGN